MLSNRFSQEDKARVWIYNPYCANCGSNQGCALHHIYGCKALYTNSICNSIMLCNLCHLCADGQNGHETGNVMRIRYLHKTLNQIISAGYEFNDNDKEFLESIQEDVDMVLHK